MTLIARNLGIGIAYWAVCAATIALTLVISLPLAFGNALSILIHAVTLVTLVWVNRSAPSSVQNALLRGLATLFLSVALLIGMFGVLYVVSVPLLHALGAVDG